MLLLIKQGVLMKKHCLIVKKHVSGYCENDFLKEPRIMCLVIRFT